MRRTSYIGVMLATSGLLVSWLGQGIWKDSPDSLWAAVAVISVLSASAIVLEARLSRLLAPITHITPHDANSPR
jgi:hypothetical protein